MLQEVKKQDVELLPGLFRERYEVNKRYLKELEEQGLLQNYYLEAGLLMPGLQVLHDPETAKLHWGWEAPTCQLRGHFLGHFLSAAAAVAAEDRDAGLEAKIDFLLKELKRCQEHNGGEWLGPIPEKYFKKLERGEYIWSPQYTMHKLLMGLLDVYRFLGRETALELLDHLSDWYVTWTDAMLERCPEAIYRGEEGGMLETWTALYEVTGKEKYRTLAERYSHPDLFLQLEEGKDPLTNCHANASIPWFHGAAKLYELTGEERYRRLVELFFKQAVTERGCYVTGGQNAGEFWTPKKLLGEYLGDNNQEFCTVYNMVRIAAYLYRWTGETVYADYIERNLYNGFLAQQNAETGMPTYFLPMRAGSRKKWGSKTRDFWCCHGTMVQAQTLYSSLIYYRCPGEVVVSQYIPSRLAIRQEQGTILLEQSVNMKYYNDQAFFDEKDESQMSRWSLRFRITCEKKQELTLTFRIPGWVRRQPTVMVNGEELTIKPEQGYFSIRREWQQEELLLYFPAELTSEKLEDRSHRYAILEGPIVLAGLCDGSVRLPEPAEQPEKFLEPQREHTYGLFPWKQSTYELTGAERDVTFVPLYEVKEEAYTIYFSKKRD